MIRIYSGKSTPADLLTNGIGTLEATYCEVYEELNGEFSCEISIPVDSAWSEYFVYGAIVKASTPRGDDYFQLDVPQMTLTDITAKGWQISNSLGAPIVLNTYLSAKTGAEALPLILASSPDETRFTGTSDITLVNNMRITQQSPLGALVNTNVDNCFLNRWGGEVYRNKFTFNINTQIGSDKGYKISLGKNLLGVRETPTGTGYTNRIIPKALTADDTDLFLPEVYIDSTIANPFDNLKHTKIYKCNGIKVGATDSETGTIPYPTAEDAYAKMRLIVAELYAQGADVPGVSIDIDFINLGDTEEYKDFIALSSVDIQLGDTVHCSYFDRDISKRVSSYKWDALSEKYTNITIGDIAPNIAKSMYAQDVDLTALKNDMTQTLKQSEKYYNTYINHTEGFVAENVPLGVKAIMNGEKIGFFDSTTNEQLGGMALIEGIVASIASMLTNDATNPAFYATIGEETIGGQVYRGIFGYVPAVSTTTPAFKITTYGNKINITSGNFSMNAGSSSIQLKTGVSPDSGYLTINTVNDSIQLYLESANAQVDIDADRIEIQFGSKAIGVDSTGAFKRSGGTTTYL